MPTKQLISFVTSSSKCQISLVNQRHCSTAHTSDNSEQSVHGKTIMQQDFAQQFQGTSKRRFTVTHNIITIHRNHPAAAINVKFKLRKTA